MKSWGSNACLEEFISDLGEDTTSTLLSMARNTFKGLLTCITEFSFWFSFSSFDRRFQFRVFLVLWSWVTELWPCSAWEGTGISNQFSSTADDIRGMQTEELPQQVGLALRSSSRLGLAEQALLTHKLERKPFFLQIATCFYRNKKECILSLKISPKGFTSTA